MNDGFRAFIEANKQKNSTVELAWACVRANGYLVVGDGGSKKNVLRKVPSLQPESVMTMFELRDGKGVGLEIKPVFVDVSCFGGNVPQDAVMDMTLKQLIKLAKVSAANEETDTSEATGEGEQAPTEKAGDQ